MEQVPSARGELQNISLSASAISFRLVLPGTVHEARYDRATGHTALRTSVGGTMVMLNRLHHAAGFGHDERAMNLWAAAVVAVSAGLLLVGATGIWMWMLRRSERRLGLLMLGVNLAFALTLIALIRRGGP
jgi:hypothetical protein